MTSLALPLVCVLLTGAPAGAADAVTLEDVLASVRDNHPKLRRAQNDVDARRGDSMSADGAFDPTLEGKAGAGLGYYGQRQAELGVSQRMPLWLGPEVYGGWRVGDDFAPYDGKYVTGTLGELAVGVRLQLARDIFIDEARYKARAAELKVAETEAKLRAMELGLAEEGAQAFLSWVNKVRRLAIARDLLQLAEERQDFLERQVRAGSLPRVALVDNERQILARRDKVISLERDEVAAALKLALYLRDASGRPLRVGPERAPTLVPPPDPDGLRDLEALVDVALERRPELTAYGRARDILETTLALAQNDALPKVQLELGASQDFGEPRSYGPGSARLETEALANVKMSWPVLMRKARGRAARATSELRGLDAEVTYVRQAIRQEVETALVSLDAARRRVSVATRALAAARRLEEAERIRLRAGGSDLISVNIREVQAASAAESLADALAEYRLANVVLTLRTGRLPDEIREEDPA